MQYLLLGKHKVRGFAKNRFVSDTAFIACICWEFAHSAEVGQS